MIEIRWISSFSAVPPLQDILSGEHKKKEDFGGCPHNVINSACWSIIQVSDKLWNTLRAVDFVSNKLGRDLLTASMHRRNNYSKENLLHCTYGHMNIVIWIWLEKMWTCEDQSFIINRICPRIRVGRYKLFSSVLWFRYIFCETHIPNFPLRGTRHIQYIDKDLDLRVHDGA